MKTKVFIGTSLDDFIASQDRNIDWLTQFVNDEAIVIGRGTFEKVLTFISWPYQKHVFLLSSTIKQVPNSLIDKITIISMGPGELLSYLSKKGFSSIYVDGGKVIQDFLKADLIDELIISKAPTIIGSSIPLFAHLDRDLQFKYIRTEVNLNGLVRSYYERKRH